MHGRFGAVAFIGAGEVASEFSKFNTKDLLPAAGIGAASRPRTKYHLNMSIDYAVGDGSSGPLLLCRRGLLMVGARSSATIEASATSRFPPGRGPIPPGGLYDA